MAKIPNKKVKVQVRAKSKGLTDSDMDFHFFRRDFLIGGTSSIFRTFWGRTSKKKHPVELSWYLHQPETHQLSQPNIRDGLTPGPIDRTPGIPGSDKNAKKCLK